MGSAHTTNALSGTRETIDIDWGRLEEAFRVLSQPKEGTFGIGDYAKKYGVTNSAAKSRLTKLVRAGVLERSDPAPGKKAYFWFKEAYDG